jgi:hypothetical protein
MTNRIATITLSFSLSFLLLIVVISSLGTPAHAGVEVDVSVASMQGVEWDDLDSHKWIGENWGDTIGLIHSAVTDW